MFPALERQLKTLAWRHHEDALGAPLRDVDIEREACAAAPDFAGRIEARALAYSTRAGLDGEVERLLVYQRRVAQAAIALCVLIGLGTARLLPDGFPSRANVVALLGALLIPNLIGLVCWTLLQLLALLRGDGAAAAWLGTQVQRISTLLTPQSASPPARAAQRALLELNAGTVAGRARLALLAHACWLAVLTGAIVGCWWLLVVRQIDFYWGSTLLGPDAVSATMETFTRPIAALGFPVPDAATIAGSRIDSLEQDAADRSRWGWFLLGSLVVYGIMPRALALLWSGATLWWSVRRGVLDFNQAGFRRLRDFLLPAATTRILDPDAVPTVTPGPNALASPETPPQGAAWLSLERKLAASGAAHDYGAVIDRAGQLRVLADLARAPEWPALVIQAPLAVTPDRGLAQFVTAIVTRASLPVHFLIVETVGVAPLPADERANRIDDWRALALTAGIPAAHIGTVAHD